MNKHIFLIFSEKKQIGSRFLFVVFFCFSYSFLCVYVCLLQHNDPSCTVFFFIFYTCRCRILGIFFFCMCLCVSVFNQEKERERFQQNPVDFLFIYIENKSHLFTYITHIHTHRLLMEHIWNFIYFSIECPRVNFFIFHFCFVVREPKNSVFWGQNKTTTKKRLISI